MRQGGRWLQCRTPRVGRLGGAGGFTLIEIGLVLLILSIMFALVIPRFGDRSHSDLVANTRRLAVTFRFLRHEAMLNGRTYRLFYDLVEHRYWAGLIHDEGGEAPALIEDSGPLGRGVTLPEPVGFLDVVLPLTAGKLQDGVAFTDFYPDGYVDLTVIHLDNGSEAYTLRVEPLTGNVYVTEGYQDFDFSV